MNIRNLTFLLSFIFAISLVSCKKGTSIAPTPLPPVGPTKTDVPAGAGDGVTFINGGTSAIFNLYAPGKKSVSLIGDFNSWTASAKYTMTNSTDGNRWWVQIDNLVATTEYAYQYLIDGTLKVADPYSRKILDPDNDKYIPASVYPNLKAYPTGLTTGIVGVMQASPTPYTWQTTSFTRPDPKNLIIYEILVRDFVATHSYQTITDSLNYFVRLGVTAIELMPVNEFEGNDSWGYNPNYMFALDKYYGTPNAYKALIDACHAKGIAVLQDIVLEDQFSSSPMVQMYWNAASNQPAANNPWFNQTSRTPYAVGHQMNHESAATVYYAQNVMKYWMQEYHIDGFRFDMGDGFTQTISGSNGAAYAAYDAGRLAIWTKYISYMKSVDPKFLITGEYWTASTEQAAVAAQGFIVWNNLSTPGEQATMGYATNPSWDISGLFYDQFNGFNSSTAYNIISYFESHDQERLQYKNTAYGNASGSYNIKNVSTGLKRNEMGAVFMFSSPGPKMIWQFGELGYDISIDYNGRLGDKPILWNYTTDPTRMRLFSVYSKMINMKLKNPVFASKIFSYNLGGAVKTIQLKDPTANIQVIGNFDVIPQTSVITFPSSGIWYDNFTGTTINLTYPTYNVTLQPGEYHLYSNVPLVQ